MEIMGVQFNSPVKGIKTMDHVDKITATIYSICLILILVSVTQLNFGVVTGGLCILVLLLNRLGIICV